MEFIIDNYVWFIVGGVITIMVIIGYIAEKTDFGKKNRVSDVVKEPKMTKEDKRKIKEEKKSEEKTRKLELEKQNKEVKVEEKVPEPVIAISDEDLYVPFGDTVKDDSLENNDVPLEDLTVPFSSLDNTEITNNSIEDLNIVPEDLTIPITDLEVSNEVNVAEPKLDENITIPVSDLEISNSDQINQDEVKLDNDVVDLVSDLGTNIKEDSSVDNEDVVKEISDLSNTYEPVSDLNVASEDDDSDDVWKF